MNSHVKRVNCIEMEQKPGQDFDELATAAKKISTQHKIPVHFKFDDKDVLIEGEAFRFIGNEAEGVEAQLPIPGFIFP